MVPKFNEKGDVQYLKQTRENGKNYAEERRALDSYYEYYIEQKADILKFMHLFVASESDIVTAQEIMDAPDAPSISNVEMFEGALKV